MAALAAPRDTVSRDGNRFNRGVAAGAVIYAGALVALNAAKFLVPGSVSPTLVADGRAASTVTGSAIDGEVRCDVSRGTFRFANAAGGDLIVLADTGNDCFILDDQTVAKTNPGGNTRSIAGKIVEVDALGVWVRIGIR